MDNMMTIIWQNKCADLGLPYIKGSAFFPGVGRCADPPPPIPPPPPRKPPIYSCRYIDECELVEAEVIMDSKKGGFLTVKWLDRPHYLPPVYRYGRVLVEKISLNGRRLPPLKFELIIKNGEKKMGDKVKLDVGYRHGKEYEFTLPFIPNEDTPDLWDAVKCGTMSSMRCHDSYKHQANCAQTCKTKYGGPYPTLIEISIPESNGTVNAEESMDNWTLYRHGNLTWQDAMREMRHPQIRKAFLNYINDRTQKDVRRDEIQWTQAKLGRGPPLRLPTIYTTRIKKRGAQSLVKIARLINTKTCPRSEGCKIIGETVEPSGQILDTEWIDDGKHYIAYPDRGDNGNSGGKAYGIPTFTRQPSAEACQKHCDKDWICDCIMYGKRGKARGMCYKRAQCQPKLFKRNSNFDIYHKERLDWAKPRKTRGHDHIFYHIKSKPNPFSNKRFEECQSSCSIKGRISGKAECESIKWHVGAQWTLRKWKNRELKREQMKVGEEHGHWKDLMWLLPGEDTSVEAVERAHKEAVALAKPMYPFPEPPPEIDEDEENYEIEYGPKKAPRRYSRRKNTSCYSKKKRQPDNSFVDNGSDNLEGNAYIIAPHMAGFDKRCVQGGAYGSDSRNGKCRFARGLDHDRCERICAAEREKSVGSCGGFTYYPHGAGLSSPFAESSCWFKQDPIDSFGYKKNLACFVAPAFNVKARWYVQEQGVSCKSSAGDVAIVPISHPIFPPFCRDLTHHFRNRQCTFARLQPGNTPALCEELCDDAKSSGIDCGGFDYIGPLQHPSFPEASCWFRREPLDVTKFDPNSICYAVGAKPELFKGELIKKKKDLEPIPDPFDELVKSKSNGESCIGEWLQTVGTLGMDGVRRPKIDKWVHDPTSLAIKRVEHCVPEHGLNENGSTTQ
eukprot:g4402.t1